MTKDFVNDYFAANPGPVRKAMITKDGQRFSVQASSGHYCTPREDRAERYSSVEVLVCNSRLKLTNWSSPAETTEGMERLWGFLPVDKVNAEIAKRGGLAS